MTSRGEVARAIAYFDSSDDVMLLHRLTREIAPKVKQQVRKLLARGDEDTIPPPADLFPAKQPAGREDAIRIVRSTNDFALLQALARSIGRRIEAIEIVASAEFDEGTRVLVPAKVEFPPRSELVAGSVVQTGTVLGVQLDSGERWEGPPSLAQKENQG